MPDSICTGARWITSTVIPIVKGLTWWLGVYGVSPNIVVYGRLVSNANTGDVTLKEKVNKPIRLIFHTENTFLSPSNSFPCLRDSKRKCLFV